MSNQIITQTDGHNVHETNFVPIQNDTIVPTSPMSVKSVPVAPRCPHLLIPAMDDLQNLFNKRQQWKIAN